MTAPSPVFPRRVFLLGLMGSGKTTVGRELAARTGWPYLDNDDLVRRSTGREPAEIEATDGEDGLHAAEADAFELALRLEPPAIVGVAAGVIDEADKRPRLSASGHVVWLRARPETLLQRVGSGAGRRAEATDPEWVSRRAEERAPLFEATATQIVDVDEMRPADIADRILDRLRARRGPPSS
ncbi:MAG TPA: shikimate kinase [Candidatus Limnocylindrales bacterium]